MGDPDPQQDRYPKKMLQTIVAKQEFLDKFTEEIILNLVKQIKEQQRFDRELRRAERAVELERMKQKFSKYGETQIKSFPKPIMAPQIIQQKPPIIQQPPRTQRPPVLPNLPAIQPKKIEQPANIKAKPEDINFFGKIQRLINDNLVTYIECPGENKNVVIKRAGISTTTDITLKNDEELYIIKSFSEKARIPLIEGMLNARIANLEISAVVSENTGSSFIIRKNPVMLENSPTQLQKPMMQFPQPGAQHQLAPVMPPVNRPFTPSYQPSQNPQFPQNSSQGQKKESFWNKKISFGK